MARRCKDTADERANMMRSSTSMDDLDQAFLNAASNGGVDGSSHDEDNTDEQAAGTAPAAKLEESASGGAAAEASKASKPPPVTGAGGATGGDGGSAKKAPTSTPKNSDKESGGQLIEKETMMRGSVSWATYKVGNERNLYRGVHVVVGFKSTSFRVEKRVFNDCLRLPTVAVYVTQNFSLSLCFVRFYTCAFLSFFLSAAVAAALYSSTFKLQAP